MRLAVLGLSFSLVAAGASGQEAEPVAPPVPVAPVAPSQTFEETWQRYQAARTSGDSEGAGQVFQEIRRLQIERNISRLEELAMALVASGLREMEAGNAVEARQDFDNAILLDPSLPAAHFGLARASGIASVPGHVLAGLTAPIATVLGAHGMASFLGLVGVLALLATVTAFSVTLLLRHGALLRHDLEEAFGARRALGIYVFLLLLPTAALQGFGWLAIWWLALLFVYSTKVDKMISVGVLMALVIVGMLANMAQPGLVGRQNPLLSASLAATAGGADTRTIAELRAAAAQSEDRDLEYLTGLSLKKGGRYDEAAALYGGLLSDVPEDDVALNNLGNIKVAQGDLDGAVALYRRGEGSRYPPFRTTFFYNLSLALLQKFEYDRAEEARIQADEISSALTQDYATEWTHESDGTVVPAVVDVGLSRDQVWAKYAGVRAGAGRPNLAGSRLPGLDVAAFGKGLMSRFTAGLLVFGLVVLAISRWRGSRLFTLRCLKCGAPFCRRCQLGTSGAGLCTQCHHLFVVRDGVSAPARNKKMQEVHEEESRQLKVFRVLSLLVPGSGQLYGQRPGLGLPLVLIWSATVAAMVLAGRLSPLTELGAEAARDWVLGFQVLILVVVYAVANLSTPSFEAAVPLPRRGVRRSRR